MRHTLKKKEILRGKKNFDLLFKQGEKVQGTIIRCLALFHPCGPQSTPIVAAAFVVPRTVKRAVDRIHIKRLLREAYRKNKHVLLQPQSDNNIMLAFLFSRRIVTKQTVPSFKEVENDMIFILHAVRKKALV